MRANLGAMALFGSWVGFQFIATLYMQQLRGWSPLETGLAIFPGGLLVALIAPRIGSLVARFGIGRLIVAGLTSAAIGYALFLPIGLDSGYWVAILPTMVLAGLGFALAHGPLNIAPRTASTLTSRVSRGGWSTPRSKFGCALVLAVVTAVNAAAAGPGSSPESVMDGYRAAVAVAVVAAVLGVVATAARRRAPRPATELAESGV